MKKELKKLLSSECAVLQINELFRLRRWILKKDLDFLGRDEEYLKLEMTTKYGKNASCSIYIESRDFEGIVKEVEKAMSKMMDELRDTLLRNLKGYHLDGREQELIELAKLAYERHKFFCEDWHEGKPIGAWFDDDNNVCVKYESGKWWHYKNLELPFPEWW